MAAKNDSLLQQADSLWKMLDDLAVTNPDGYKKLIDNVIKEQKEQWKPPDPVFCFRTVKLPESTNHHVFINICKWDRVSKPRDDQDKISVVASNLRDLPGGTSKHSVMDICFHNDIINETGNGQGRKLLASLSLDYVEKQTSVKLSRSYKMLSIKYKGDIEELKRFLFSRDFAGTPAKPGSESSSQGSSILDSLSKIVPGGKEPRRSEIPNETQFIRKTDDDKTPKKPLIEEVTTSKRPKANVMPKLTVPKHSMEVVKATSERPKCIVVKVDLPDIQSGVECELDVSKQDLVLCSPKHSKLQLQLPEQGNEEETSSTFNKATNQLTIIIPVGKT